MVDGASLHPTALQQAPSWRSCTTSSGTAKKVATAPSAAETSSNESFIATAVPPVSLQIPCSTGAGGAQAITCMPYPPAQDIQILPNYQSGYTVLDPAKVASPCIDGVFSSPQQIVVPGQSNQQVLLGSLPQGFTNQPLISGGVQYLQHDGVRQIQASPLPVQLQLSQAQQPVLPVNQTTVQPLQVLGQSVPIPRMMSPGTLKVSVGNQIEGSRVLYSQQVVPSINPAQLISDPAHATAASPQVLVPHFQPSGHSQVCGIPLCASPCGTAHLREVERVAIPPTAPAYYPFTPVQQQPIVNHGSVALPLPLARGSQLDFQGGSPCLVSGANACAATTSIGPSVVVLPWDSQRSIMTNAPPGGTQTTVIAGVPSSTYYSVGPPTTTITLDPSFRTQQSAIVPGSVPLLRTVSLGSTLPTNGVVQLVQMDASGASYPRMPPPCINVVPNSLAALVPGDRFNRRQRGQPTGSSRQRSYSAQPFASCCRPTASNSGQMSL